MAEGPGRVVIRKYENRRLYDTASSRYVNLDDIAQMVREGVDVQVLDAATGEDLTRLVLTQIIVEDVKEPGSGFPLDVLRQMVVASGRASQEGVLRYMKAMFDMYQNAWHPFSFMQPPAAAPQPPPPEADNMDELRRRIGDLERLVAEQAARPAAAKRGRKPKTKR